VGRPEGGDGVLVSVHRACLPGDLFRSAPCDCGRLLRGAMSAVAKAGVGVVIYLQDQSLPWCAVGHSGSSGSDCWGVGGQLLDSRGDTDETIRTVAQIVRALGVGSITVMCSRPAVSLELERAGISVAGSTPVGVYRSELTGSGN
jgi:GTP cyclohydrolase II